MDYFKNLRTPNDEIGIKNEEINHQIEIDDCIKIYKRGKIEVVALRGLTCKFHPGEITVIMGPSGCGKTTLLNLIGGLDRPTSGKIIVDGKDICKLSEKEIEKYRRNKIGYVFQFMNLIPELDARENIALPMLLTGKSSQERNLRVNEMLKMVRLENRGHHKPDEMSGGEQQRIAIAAAFSNNPGIILCDEPTGELDSDSKYMIMALLRAIISKFRDKIIIIVTHDTELNKVADRLYYIRDGVISHEMTREDILKQTQASDTSQTGENAEKLMTSEKFIRELRELEFIIKKKIENLEKDKK